MLRAHPHWNIFTLSISTILGFSHEYQIDTMASSDGITVTGAVNAGRQTRMATFTTINWPTILGFSHTK